jgi:excisionase family DNA binding protein
MDKPEPLVLSVSETAALLAIGETLAYELIARGVIPSLRLGRLVRVPREGLLEFVSTASVGQGAKTDHVDTEAEPTERGARTAIALSASRRPLGGDPRSRPPHRRPSVAPPRLRPIG